MDGIEARKKRGVESQRIFAEKGEWIVRLVYNVYAHHVETGPMVAHGRTSRAAE